MAVDLAKLSLWLATLAKSHPFTFLDHSLRHGDSLVGLTRRQIESFNWEEDKQQSFIEAIIRTRTRTAGEHRQRILAARDEVPYSLLEQQLVGVDEALQLVREVADTVVSAFFSSGKPKDRHAKRIVLRDLTEAALKDTTAKACDEIEETV